MNYDAFKVLAFTQYGISPQLIDVIRPWVEENMPTGKGSALPSASLGYGELVDIQTVDAGMKAMQEIIFNSTLMETPKKTAKALEKFNKDAGGREGKNIYRYALKTVWLMRTRTTE
jgi:hypothetical protein